MQKCQLATLHNWSTTIQDTNDSSLRRHNGWFDPSVHESRSALSSFSKNCTSTSRTNGIPCNGSNHQIKTHVLDFHDGLMHKHLTSSYHNRLKITCDLRIYMFIILLFLQFVLYIEKYKFEDDAYTHTLFFMLTKSVFWSTSKSFTWYRQTLSSLARLASTLTSILITI